MLKQRLITALVLLPVVFWGLFGLSVEHFSWFVAAVVALGAWEWARLSGFAGQGVRCIYAALMLVSLWLVDKFASQTVLYLSVGWWVLSAALVLTYPKTAGLWQSRPARLLAGFLTLVPLWVGMVFIRSAEISLFSGLDSLWILLYVLLIVWVADTGAYFAGKAWGNKKLAPAVSPGKSWAGVWGGLAANVVLASVFAQIQGVDWLTTLQWVLVTLGVASVSVIGDLAESMYKRNEGIKDSSQLLPGHGGILDRIDSLNAAVPVFASLLLIFGWMS